MGWEASDTLADTTTLDVPCVPRVTRPLHDCCCGGRGGGGDLQDCGEELDVAQSDGEAGGFCGGEAGLHVPDGGEHVIGKSGVDFGAGAHWDSAAFWASAASSMALALASASRMICLALHKNKTGIQRQKEDGSGRREGLN